MNVRIINWQLLHPVGDLFEQYDDARTYLLTPWSRVLLEKLTIKKP
jgi:hypothetical protein